MKESSGQEVMVASVRGLQTAADPHRMRQFGICTGPAGVDQPPRGRAGDWNDASWWDGRKKYSVPASLVLAERLSVKADAFTKGCIGVQSRQKLDKNDCDRTRTYSP